MTEKSLGGQLIDNDIKKFRQDIETEIKITSHPPIAFLHKHRHIVQTTGVKEFSGKYAKDRIIFNFF